MVLTLTISTIATIVATSKAIKTSREENISLSDGFKVNFNETKSYFQAKISEIIKKKN